MENLFLLKKPRSREGEIRNEANLGKAMEAKSRNSPRKKLADISNLPLRKRLSSQDKIPEQIPACSKEYIERIQKVYFVFV